MKRFGNLSQSNEAIAYFFIVFRHAQENVSGVTSKIAAYIYAAKRTHVLFMFSSSVLEVLLHIFNAPCAKTASKIFIRIPHQFECHNSI